MKRRVWALALVVLAAAGRVQADAKWEWGTAATPESQGMSSAALDKAWDELNARSTTGFLVIRNDCVVFERYAKGWNRHKPHGTASMAKALVGGTSLMVAMSDGRIRPDDPASTFVPQWRDLPRKKDITIRHLATHTSGIEDAEQNDLPHDQLTGWKGDFWKRLAVPNDPFTIARDVAPVLDVPGTNERYSNPGIAMLGYCITAAIRGTADQDIKSLLKHRVMDPIGVAENEWSVGYGKPVAVDGLSLIAPWGGGSYSADATARVGRLMMRGGNWQGRQLIDPGVVRAATTFSGTPNHSGLVWWVNHNPDGSKFWKDAPADAFSGSGAGQQFLMVVPSLKLIIVRNGVMMDKQLSHSAGLEKYVITPVMRAIVGEAQARPASPSSAVGFLAVKDGDTITVTSQGSTLSYKAIVDGKRGGDITQLSLPANSPVVARELNDLFYHGTHGQQYTLRGWTGLEKCNLSCSIDLISQKPDEVVVQANLLATGTYKVLESDAAARANIRKSHVSYKDKTVQVKRTYTFKPDRILESDELTWVSRDTEATTVYFTSAFMPRSIQGPVRLVGGGSTAGFPVTTSGGRKLPAGVAYPFTAENFLKNGYKISARTTATSFDLGKSDMYFYEKPWQQDWYQSSGFMCKLADSASSQPISISHSVIFSKASVSEMPPVVTIQSPSWDARWMDEKGEVPNTRIGDTVKLSAVAVNSDGSPVPDQDISWEIHVDPWWQTPAVTLPGGHPSYTFPEVANEQDKAAAKDRQLLAVMSVKVKGKNGAEAVEPFAMLVGKAQR